MTLKRRPAVGPGAEWLAYSAATAALYAVMRRNRVKNLVTREMTNPGGGFGEVEFALAAKALTPGQRALLFEDVAP